MSGRPTPPPPGARPAPLPAVPRPRRPRRAEPDPIDRLAERHREFIAAAVHPDEIAALLESDGISDARTRARYGCRNSFALAEELFERVERTHPEPAGPAHDPWRIGLLGCLLRGVVFALPGLAYVLGAPLLAGPRDGSGLPADTVPLLAGALCGWMWNQGLAHRAYSWLTLGDRAACRRSLARGAPAGALLCTAVACLAADGDPGAVVFAAGEACYLGAATVLLVLGRERALLHCLLPMTAGALVALVRPVPDWAVLTLLTASLVTVVLLALHEVAPALRERGAADRRRRPAALLGTPGGAPGQGLAAPRLSTSLPYAVFGLGTGVLVLHATLGEVVAHGGGTAAAPAAVALTLSMGPAEWLLYRFRSEGLAGLRSTSTPGAFRRATAVTVVQCLAGYLATLLVLAHATAALWPAAPDLDGVHLAGLLLLGAVLWTGLLLQSFGAVPGAAAVCCAAAAAQTLALATHPGDPHGIGLLVHGIAAALQAGLVCGLLGRATAHR
ncbi:hypothetical protein [Streptomyces sp. AC495_CC817]|uniref:hypothetical protein n=1 Tax=Streptomyces sp. AC495_CC817 TaxID=2823900 RepID=UPI001C26C378|nr:hypothetical protein [Streptomyces sp. AC495_CC817]